MTAKNYCIAKDKILINPGKEQKGLAYEQDATSVLYADLKEVMKGKGTTVVRMFYPYSLFSHLKNLIPVLLLDAPIQWSLVPIEDVLSKLTGHESIEAFGYNWAYKGEKWTQVEKLDSKPYVLTESDVINLYMNQDFGLSSVVEPYTEKAVSHADLLGDTRLKMFGMLLAAFPEVLRSVSRDELLFIVGFEIPKMGSIQFHPSRHFEQWQLQQFRSLSEEERQVFNQWSSTLAKNYSLSCNKNFARYLTL